MLTKQEYYDVRLKWFGEHRRKARITYKRYLQAMIKNYTDCEVCENASIKKKSFFGGVKSATNFAPLNEPYPCTAVCPCDKPCPEVKCPESWYTQSAPVKQEGKTPMRYNETTAIATINAIQSDVAIARDHLLNRLAKADNYLKDRSFADLFNLNVNNEPKTFVELIEMIKKGKYTINPKVEKQLEAYKTLSDTSDESDDMEEGWFYGPMYGIIWNGPKANRKGYNEALVEKGRRYTLAKDIIMTSDAATGLAALYAFEDWMPKA